MTRTDTKEAALAGKLADREFGDSDVIDFLAGMDIDRLISKLGEPKHFTEYAHAPGWNVGDGRPPLANDDPAVMQSLARCAAARTRWEDLPPTLVVGVIHPATCDWCEYPVSELLKACSWSVHQSGYVVADVLIWEGKERSIYSRPAGLTGYQNRIYRTFWELPIKERERRIEAATGRLVAA